LGDVLIVEWCQHIWSSRGVRRILAGVEGGERVVHKEQTVSEMVEEVLTRQAEALVAQTGETFKAAMDAVSNTDAGRQLGELAEGPHRHERARDWQVGVARERSEERRYLWLEGYLEWLEGKETRGEYYTLLEELASLRG
jgi:hypothetical protein